MEKLTVGSLFAGIGGFELGLERTDGFETVWQCEIDPFCQKVLAKHWPNVKRFSDIKTMGIDEEIPYVDVICGGFPCQDISCAGKKVGIHGKRSGLFFEFMRVCSIIRPKFIMLENVAAIINNGLSTVLEEIAKIGYDAEWSVISASDFGAPHLRERWFAVAYTNSINGRKIEIDIGKSKNWNITEDIGSRYILGRKDFDRNISWNGQSSICRISNGIPNQLDRLRALGNAIVPQCSEYVGNCVLDYYKNI